MFYRIRTRLKRLKHDFRCRKIRETPPLQIKYAPLKILSMVSHQDLTMYLVAVKSFYRQVREGSLVIINDGSLTSADITILSQHLGSPEILRMQDVQTDACPKGGCWERLLTVIDFSAKNYVIQLDSDTLTRAAVPEVVGCYRANRSFILGTNMGRSIVSLPEASEFVRDATRDHVQIFAERNFVRLKNAQNLRYVRGSAGFAGFAKGAFARQPVEEFSTAMTELIGATKWSEWGSEQVTSNYTLANSPNAMVLPYPKYAGFNPDLDLSVNVFLHFIGTYRFTRGVYARESVRIVRELI
jgi:hypothetical protein